jgi:hypothetical protein
VPLLSVLDGSSRNKKLYSREATGAHRGALRDDGEGSRRMRRIRDLDAHSQDLEWCSQATTRSSSLGTDATETGRWRRRYCSLRCKKRRVRVRTKWQAQGYRDGKEWWRRPTTIFHGLGRWRGRIRAAERDIVSLQ